MKIRYSSIVGILAMLVLIASFVVPAKLATPEPVSAQQPPMEWLPVDTPDTEPGILKALYTPVPFGAAAVFTGAGPEAGTEITKLLIGNDGTTMYVRYTRGDATNVSAVPPGPARSRLLKSVDGGVTWSTAAYNNLDAACRGGGLVNSTIVWDIAIAPDNPAIIACAVSNVTAAGVIGPLPAAIQGVYLSTNGGTSWDNTNWPTAAAALAPALDYISCIDISMDYGGARDILVGTRDGTGAATNNLQTMKIPGYGGWSVQNAAGAPTASTNFFTGDVIDAKFSPTYIGDSTIVVLYAKAATVAPVVPVLAGTYLTWGRHDLVMNWTAYEPQANAIEIAVTAGTSPTNATIITGMLQMPSDYSGQSASLRRVYVCTDASPGAVAGPTPGVFRVDDNVLYTLMDNTLTSAAVGVLTNTRRAATIAYWGTYASGKLLVGERLGQQCVASVDTWFTDSPTTCPVPCWYPAKKPVSGAAGDVACTPNEQGWGNAYVVWSPTYAAQGVAYAVTGSSSFDVYAAIVVVGQQQQAFVSWPQGLFNAVGLDESGFALTRNNGETWNELSLIDTRINKLTDVAPSADCTTVYLASVNNAAACKGFDSVWRSSVNEKVVAPPLPALPIGAIWERVRVSPTGPTCDNNQSNYAILRVAPDKEDGQVVGWAAGGSDGRTFNTGENVIANTFLTGANTTSMAWSPDYGDYWANVTPRIAVEDFAFESSTIIYVVEAGTGNVQKLPYTGTAWSSALPNITTNLGGGHTIEAKAPDKVLVGNEHVAVVFPGVLNVSATPFPAAISLDGGMSFVPMVRTIPEAADNGYHAIFDTDYGVGNNTTIYVASDAAQPAPGGKIYRNNAPAGANVPWTDMITGFTTHMEYYGLVQSNSKNVTGQGTLYAAHTGNAFVFSGVERTLRPLDGIPKPGIQWDCLHEDGTYQNGGVDVQFDLEPKSLKLCGCLTADTNTTLYAIDNDRYGSNHNGAYSNVYGYGAGVYTPPPDLCGRLWAYVDCVAKKGPTLTMDDGTIIGCDPATGRAQEVNFTWEQLCIADRYQLQISKNDGFNLQVYDSGIMAALLPPTLMSPSFIYYSNEASSPFGFIPLECGHTYYWHVRVRGSVTGEIARSPWSDTRSFTIKAGFRVTTPYYGPQLLAPDNGCGCACDAPLCFSWSPFKESTEYKFELSENADMSSPLVSTSVKTTAYQYTGTVKCNKNYFWRVMAVAPAPSEWSAVFSFMTQPEPPPPPAPAPAPEIPMWVWILIAIGAIFVIVLIVLIFKTRRV